MKALPKTCSSASAATSSSYYRCFLPAVALGADYATWVADRTRRDQPRDRLRGPPPKLEDLFDFEVVVVQ